MKNGKFTPQERAYLESLDVVKEVRATSIIYSKQFKSACMERYHNGEAPSKIFESVGLLPSLLGYNRIECAIYCWKAAEKRDALGVYDAPKVRHKNRIATMKAQKHEALVRQRELRARQTGQLKERLVSQKERYEEKLVRQDEKARKALERKDAKIRKLETQVAALKALGTLARKSRCAKEMTNKSERFELIYGLALSKQIFNISAACEALEVSRSGYYEWVGAFGVRSARETSDLADKALIEKALAYRGFKKGTRQVVSWLKRHEAIVWNRKHVQRIMRKYDLFAEFKRKRPYEKIGLDGQPKIADNVVKRDFYRGDIFMVGSTDITYLPYKGGFVYLSALIDCQSREVLGYKVSKSLKMGFVLETFDQLKGKEMGDNFWVCSDQGVHYTSKIYKQKLKELGCHQSMSRRACCWDNAPIESFWGRMKTEIGPTKNLSFKQITSLVDSYMAYYNTERGQEALGGLSPWEYAAQSVA